MLSQTTEYALRAMSCLALSPDALVPTAILAERTRVPPHYLAKVLQQLAAAGLVRGRRGVRGGYQLNRAADEISLIEVIRSVTELNRIPACPPGTPNGKLCPLHRAMDAAAKAVIDLYSGVTLADLASGAPPLCDFDAALAPSRMSASGAAGR